MSRERFIGLALAAALSLVLSGCGAHGSGVEFGAFGSYIDSDDLGSGYGGGAKLELNPIDLVSIDGRASWIHFDNTNIDMIPLEVAGLLNLPLLGERIVPYVGAGVGYYMFEDDLDDDWGFFPLVGMELGFQSCSLMAEARWLMLEADTEDGLTEADVDGFGANLGLIFRF